MLITYNDRLIELYKLCGTPIGQLAETKQLSLMRKLVNQWYGRNLSNRDLLDFYTNLSKRGKLPKLGIH